MAAENLNAILAAKGYNRNALNHAVNSSHLTNIAVRIGDWESCATFLGIPQEDVDDINEENRRVRKRRIAMLQRWKQLKGREATYLNLMESFAQLGRKDLIEFVLIISPDVLGKQEDDSEEYININVEGAREARHMLLLFLTSILQTRKCIATGLCLRPCSVNFKLFTCASYMCHNVYIMLTMYPLDCFMYGINGPSGPLEAEEWFAGTICVRYRMARNFRGI